METRQDLWVKETTLAQMSASTDQKVGILVGIVINKDLLIHPSVGSRAT